MPHHRNRSHGYTIQELMVALAVMAVVASMGIPSTQRWRSDQEARAMASSVANALHFARQEAIRTRSNQVVFLGAGGAGDVAGNPLQDTAGKAVPILILNDGAPGSANQNCTIDAGEDFITVPAGRDVGWGWSLSGGAKPSDDATPIASNSGSSFATPSGAPATWVLFRPDGTPLAFDASCNVGAIGSGNGAIYLSNGTRDYAITLRALGSVKVHSWNAGAGWEG